MTTLRERLLGRLVIDQETGCLLWTGYIDAGGYGRIRLGPEGNNDRVHRVMWRLFEGPVPDGKELDHLCRVTHCASIAHLEPVTHRINTLRGISPPAAWAARDCCEKGHEFDLLNTYFYPNGSRECRACRRANWPRKAARQRERAAAS